MYTFFHCRPDGSAPSFEAYELASDEAARSQAERLLDQHRTCSHIIAYDGDRDVVTVRRDDADHPGAPRAPMTDALRVADSARPGVAVIVTDPGGAVVFWNQGAAKLYGWPAVDALGADILDVTPALQSKVQAQEIMTALQAGDAWTGEIVLKRRNGAPFSAFVADTPVGELGQGGVIVGISAPAGKQALVREAQSEFLAALRRA